MNAENPVSKLVITNKFIVKGELAPLHDGMLKYISNKVWSESASNDSFNVLNEAHALSHSEVAALDLNPSVLGKDGLFKIMVSRNPVLKMTPHLGVMQLSYFFKENHNVFLESIIITKNEAMYNDDKLVVKVGRVGPMVFNDLEQERVLSNYHFIHGNAIRSYIDEMIEVQRNEENGDCPVELVLRPGTYLELSHAIKDTDKINQIMEIMKDAPINKSLWDQSYPMYNALSDKGKPVSMDDYPYGLFADVEGLIGQLHTPNDPHGFEHLGMVMIPTTCRNDEMMNFNVKLISRNRDGNGLCVYNLFNVSGSGTVERRIYDIVSRDATRYTSSQSPGFIDQFKQLLKLIDNPDRGNNVDGLFIADSLSKFQKLAQDKVVTESSDEPRSKPTRRQAAAKQLIDQVTPLVAEPAPEPIVEDKPKTSRRRSSTRGRKNNVVAAMISEKGLLAADRFIKDQTNTLAAFDEPLPTPLHVPQGVVEEPVKKSGDGPFEQRVKQEVSDIRMMIELFPEMFVESDDGDVSIIKARLAYVQCSPESIEQMRELLEAKRVFEKLAEPLRISLAQIIEVDEIVMVDACL